MKSDKLLDAIGEVRDDYIRDAYVAHNNPHGFKPLKNRMNKTIAVMIAVAACAVLVFSIHSNWSVGVINMSADAMSIELSVHGYQAQYFYKGALQDGEEQLGKEIEYDNKKILHRKFYRTTVYHIKNHEDFANIITKSDEDYILWEYGGIVSQEEYSVTDDMGFYGFYGVNDIKEIQVKKWDDSYCAGLYTDEEMKKQLYTILIESEIMDAEAYNNLMEQAPENIDQENEMWSIDFILKNENIYECRFHPASQTLDFYYNNIHIRLNEMDAARINELCK